LLPTSFVNTRRAYSIIRFSAGIMFVIMVAMMLVHGLATESLQKSQLEQFQSIITNSVWNWFPSGWLANCLYSLVTGRIVSFIVYGLPLIIISYILFHLHCFRIKRRKTFPEPANIK
jgi:hypothetical protein